MALLVAAGSGHRLVLLLIFAQIFIATFVALTMMGWWFPGRTLLTVLPLLVAPIVLMVSKLPLWGRITIAVLGLLTMAKHIRSRGRWTGRGDHHRRRPVRRVISRVPGPERAVSAVHMVDKRDLVADLLLVGAGRIGDRGRNLAGSHSGVS